VRHRSCVFKPRSRWRVKSLLGQTRLSAQARRSLLPFFSVVNANLPDSCDVRAQGNSAKISLAFGYFISTLLISSGIVIVNDLGGVAREILFTPSFFELTNGMNV